MGLLTPMQGQTPQQQPPQDQPMQQAPQQGAQQSQPQGGMFERFVTMGMKIIHSEATRDEVIRKLGSGDPQEALGETLLWLIMRLEDVSKKQGVEISVEDKVNGALELLEELVSVGEASGAITGMTEEQKHMAFAYALQERMKQAIANGETTPEELQQAVAQAQSGGQNGIG